MNVKKIKNVIMIVLLLSIIMVSNEFTLAYLLDKTSPLISKFIPYDYTTGNFTISKLIEHSLGEDYLIPDNIEFEFQVDLGSYYANQLIVTSQGEFKTDEEGIFNIKVKPNVDLVISDIEDGTNVKITEIQKGLGFSAKDDSVKEITISSDEDLKLEFINVYEPLLVTGENITLIGLKVLEGREWQEGDSFSFTLEYLNELNEWVVMGTKTIIYDKDNVDFNKYDFNEIIRSFEFKDAKTYKFRLSEVLGSLENVDYDKTINNFEIVIGDKLMDGQLDIHEINGYQNITIVENENNYNVEVIFNNVYKEEDLEIEYVDKVDQSLLHNENIIVKNDDYTMGTVISKFEGLSENYTYTVYDKDDNIYESNLVRTGDYVIVKNNNNEYRYNLVFSGDVSGDGFITPLDYVKIKNHIIAKTLLPGVPYELAADVSGDDEITPLDYVKVKNYIIKGGN